MPPEQIDSLADDVKPLVLGLLRQISGLTARVDELLAQNKALLARIADLAALLPADANEAGRALADRRAAAALALPGAVGAPFAGWSKAKGALDKTIVEARAKAAAVAGTCPAPLAPWSVHDLRRTVATGLQRLGVRLEVTEALVYQRHDWAGEKRAALDARAAHVLATVEGRIVGGNIVSLARAG